MVELILHGLGTAPLFITSEQSDSQQTEFPTGRRWREAATH
jgi:hypothetical protein